MFLYGGKSFAAGQTAAEFFVTTQPHAIAYEGPYVRVGREAQ